MYVVIFKTYPQSKWKAYVDTYADKRDAQNRVNHMIRSGTHKAVVQMVFPDQD